MRQFAPTLEELEEDLRKLRRHCGNLQIALENTLNIRQWTAAIAKNEMRVIAAKLDDIADFSERTLRENV